MFPMPSVAEQRLCWDCFNCMETLDQGGASALLATMYRERFASEPLEVRTWYYDDIMPSMGIVADTNAILVLLTGVRTSNHISNVVLGGTLELQGGDYAGVHPGFLRIALTVFERLQTVGPTLNRALYFFGHSYGGGAALACHKIARLRWSQNTVRTVAVAPPRALTPFVARSFATGEVQCYQNTDDPVPYVCPHNDESLYVRNRIPSGISRMWDRFNWPDDWYHVGWNTGLTVGSDRPAMVALGITVGILEWASHIQGMLHPRHSKEAYHATFEFMKAQYRGTSVYAPPPRPPQPQPPAQIFAMQPLNSPVPDEQVVPAGGVVIVPISDEAARVNSALIQSPKPFRTVAARGRQVGVTRSSKRRRRFERTLESLRRQATKLDSFDSEVLAAYVWTWPSNATPGQ